MLVACQLVNRATWAEAEFAFKTIRNFYRDHEYLAIADAKDLFSIVRRLGFTKTRGPRLIEFAVEWCNRDYDRRPNALTRDEILSLPGCGDYAADSYEIFVLNRLSISPSDDKLRDYVLAKRGY